MRVCGGLIFPENHLEPLFIEMTVARFFGGRAPHQPNAADAVYGDFATCRLPSASHRAQRTEHARIKLWIWCA
jgi:hypothetical protein